MKNKHIIPREQANRDVDDAVAYYLNEAAESVALGFIDALEQAIADIEKEVGLGLEPFRQAARLLSTMPGLKLMPASRATAATDAPGTRLRATSSRLNIGLCSRRRRLLGVS